MDYEDHLSHVIPVEAYEANQEKPTVPNIPTGRLLTPSQQQTDTEPTANIANDVYSPASIIAEDIPPRDWVYAHLMLSGYISALVAPGGTGKSLFTLVMAVSVALGRSLVNGHEVAKARNVLILNNEDDQNELNRRIAAVCSFYNIHLSELEGKLFLRSGYEYPVVVARTGVVKNVSPTPHRDALIELIKKHNIELVIADPYVSFHEVAENDNMLQNEVIKVFRNICAKTGVAILLVAHTKKLGGDSESHAGDAESMRGATAVKDGARIAFTLARMSKKTAKDWGIDWQMGNRLIRLDDAKKNLSLKGDEATWFRMASHQLPNGDWVDVPETINIEPFIDAATQKNEVKMNGHTLADQIERVSFNLNNRNEFMYSDIKTRLMVATDLGKSTIESYVTLLSQDQNRPTRIKVGDRIIDYWTSKETGRTSPWIVHRLEIK